jgi:two-component system CheB/CheR fusion protein
MLTDILSRSTTMPVHTARNDMTVEPNSVYVIPPDVNVSISENILNLQRRTSKQYRPIDEFLFSLAQDKKNLAVGVILSGTGTDGTDASFWPCSGSSEGAYACSTGPRTNRIGKS